MRVTTTASIARISDAPDFPDLSSLPNCDRGRRLNKRRSGLRGRIRQVSGCSCSNGRRDLTRGHDRCERVGGLQFRSTEAGMAVRESRTKPRLYVLFWRPLVFRAAGSRSRRSHPFTRRLDDPGPGAAGCCRIRRTRYRIRSENTRTSGGYSDSRRWLSTQAWLRQDQCVRGRSNSGRPVQRAGRG